MSGSRQLSTNHYEFSFGYNLLMLIMMPDSISISTLEYLHDSLCRHTRGLAHTAECKHPNRIAVINAAAIEGANGMR